MSHEYGESEMRTKAVDMLPLHMVEGVMSYVMKGRKTGDFLRGVLENDLTMSVLHADRRNQACLESWVDWLVWYAPPTCWGSPDKVRAWIKVGGLEGRS